MDQQTAEKQFINGSESYKSYLVVARRGNIVLGVKPLGLTDGSVFGAEGRTYMSMRLRSAFDGEAPEVETDGNVAKLPEKLELDTAWPEIKFDKLGSKRASAIVGIFVRGSLKNDPVEAVKRIRDGDFIAQMADFVVQKAGRQYMVLPREEIAAYLHEKLDPVLKRVEEKAETAAKVKEHIEQNTEIFEFQKTLLGNMFQEAQQDEFEPGDEDETVADEAETSQVDENETDSAS